MAYTDPHLRDQPAQAVSVEQMEPKPACRSMTRAG
jgi:hypothetical protein